MFAIRNFGFFDNVSLNLDSAHPFSAGSDRLQRPARNVLGREDIFMHVNLQALETLGMESSAAVHLRFEVVPVADVFKGESNWRVVIDSQVSAQEKSAITGAARNVQRIFDLAGADQCGRGLRT